MSPDTVEQAAAAAAVLHGPGHNRAQDAAKAHPAPAAASKVGAWWPACKALETGCCRAAAVSAVCGSMDVSGHCISSCSAWPRLMASGSGQDWEQDVRQPQQSCKVCLYRLHFVRFGGSACWQQHLAVRQQAAFNPKQLPAVQHKSCIPRSMQTCSSGQADTCKRPFFRTTAVIQASVLGPRVGQPMEHLTGAELAARELHPTISGGSAIR